MSTINKDDGDDWRRVTRNAHNTPVCPPHLGRLHPEELAVKGVYITRIQKFVGFPSIGNWEVWYIAVEQSFKPVTFLFLWVKIMLTDLVRQLSDTRNGIA